MPSINLPELLKLADSAAQSGRDLLRGYFGELSQVKEKLNAGLVSEADLESEKLITGILGKSGIPVLGEEESFRTKGMGGPSKGRRWVVDPLDGTTNFVHGFPIYCISIGLEWDGELVLGVIDVPELSRRYQATRGGGAFVNGRPLHVSSRSELRESLLATGFFAYENPKDIDEQVEALGRLIRRTRGIRRAGAAAYDLCMVAEGVFDGFWEKNLSPWDTAAGTVLVREAGGRVTDYSNCFFDVGMQTLLASNGLIHEQIQVQIVGHP